MRGVPNEKGQLEAVRLRVEERLSFREIQDRTGISKSSLSRWLLNHPLSEEELHAKHQAGVTKPRVGARKDRGERSKYHEMLTERELTPSEKGNIAEAAILFRCTLYGLHVMAPVFDGGRTDWLVQVPSGDLAKIQVKWASAAGRHGLPHLSLTRTEGHSRRQRYSKKDFDFLVGYSLYTDTAYVFSWDETDKNKTVITIREDVAEDWDKVLTFGAVVQREDNALAVRE